MLRLDFQQLYSRVIAEFPRFLFNLPLPTCIFQLTFDSPSDDHVELQRRLEIDDCFRVTESTEMRAIDGHNLVVDVETDFFGQTSDANRLHEDPRAEILMGKR